MTMQQRSAFTLIEISIVLVIIGLIIGGVLLGKDMIAAAEIRSQISQIEKYKTATNTFRLKYGALPGDLAAASASQLGFTTRSNCAGAGNGDGLIEGNIGGCLAGWNRGYTQTFGETGLFWNDLSSAQLIDGNFTAATGTATPGILTGTALDPYFPKAKIAGNYIYVWSGGPAVAAGVNNGINYLSLGPINRTDNSGTPNAIDTAPTPDRMMTALTALQAYAIDLKLDDGVPQSGKVIALFLGGASNYASWASGSYTTEGAHGTNNTPSTTPTAISATTCFDNNNATGTQSYSVGYNSGNSSNCGLTMNLQ